MSASSESDGTRRTKASVQDAIGKLIGDDAACEQARRDADKPVPVKKPPAKD